MSSPAKRQIRTFIISCTVFFLPVFLFWGCSFRKPDAGTESFKPQNSALILPFIEQYNSVTGFHSTGKISVKGWVLGKSAGIFMAGTKDPMRIKIEITHSWGKPVLHILIDRDRLEILDYNDKKAYSGEFSPEGLSDYFPGSGFSEEMLWGVFRGLPDLSIFEKGEYRAPGKVRLTKKDGSAVSLIEFSQEGSSPDEISLKYGDLSIKFSDFSEIDNTRFAGKVKIEDVLNSKDLILTRNKIVFNRKIPDEVFSVEIPNNFERLSLYQ